MLKFPLLLAAILSVTVPVMGQALHLGKYADGASRTAPCQSTGNPARRMKGIELPESVAWDATISNAGNFVGGGTIYCFAQDGDDLYVAGDFSQFDTIAANNIVHYNRQSKRWNALEGGTNSIIYALAVHNGQLYAGGAFLNAGTAQTVVNHVAVWNGTRWNKLGGGMTGGTSGNVNALAFYGNTLYAGGDFTFADGYAAYNLAEWNGSIWSEAGNGVSGRVTDLFVTQDSLFVCGDFSKVNTDQTVGILANGIALFHGNKWTIYPGAPGMGGQKVVFWHNMLWTGGDFYNSLNKDIVFTDLAVYDGVSWSSHSTDSSPGTANASATIMDILPVGDSLFFTGCFTVIGGVPARHLALYYNGAFSEVGNGLYGYGNWLAFFDGSLYVGGAYSAAGTKAAIGIASLNGIVWSSPGMGKGISTLPSVDVIAANDRYIVAAGRFLTVAGQLANHIAAYDKSAQTWSPLGAGVDGDVFALSLQGNTLTVGGNFGYCGTVRAANIATYDLSAHDWAPMGEGARHPVFALASDGTSTYAPYSSPAVYTNNTDTYDNYIGKWDGTSWTVEGGAVTGYVWALVYADHALYAAGQLSIADGTIIQNIAELPDGGGWQPLGGGLIAPSYQPAVYALAMSGGQLYAAGLFNASKGLTGTLLSVAVWDGTAWSALGTGFDYLPYAVTADGAGGAYFGGGMTNAGGVAVNDLAHWNASSATYDNVSGGVNNTIVSLATDATSLYAGGFFTKVGPSLSIVSDHFAALKGAGADVAPNVAGEDALSISIAPNPMMESASAQVTLPVATPLRLDLVNDLGVAIETLASGTYAAGQQSFAILASALPDGLYFVRLAAHGRTITRQLLLQR